MKYPITLSLALPILLIVSNYIGGDGNTVLVTIGVLGLMFLLEIKIKYGNVSTDTIKKFFNTPIEKQGAFGEASEDTSPKVSISAGILIILGGTVLVILLLGLYFSFTQ